MQCLFSVDRFRVFLFSGALESLLNRSKSEELRFSRHCKVFFSCKRTDAHQALFRRLPSVLDAVYGGHFGNGRQPDRNDFILAVVDCLDGEPSSVGSPRYSDLLMPGGYNELAHVIRTLAASSR
jgi:hypothetical protein